MILYLNKHFRCNPIVLVTDLLPKLRELSRADKLRVMQFLVAELAKEEGVTPLENEPVYRVWFPYDAFEAANILGKMLTEHQEGKEA